MFKIQSGNKIGMFDFPMMSLTMIIQKWEINYYNSIPTLEDYREHTGIVIILYSRLGTTMESIILWLKPSIISPMLAK